MLGGAYTMKSKAMKTIVSSALSLTMALNVPYAVKLHDLILLKVYPNKAGKNYKSFRLLL